MKIYISEKENIDLSKNCFLTFSIKDKQTVDWNVLAQSLEQHDKELRKQERQKVITELEEWIKTNSKYYLCRTQTNHLQGKSFSPHMVGASISVYLDTFKDDIDQKLNKMKG